MESLAHNLNDKQKKALSFTAAGALLFGAYFLRSYFGLIVVAAIVAYMFMPVYVWLKKKTKHQGSAASLTFLVVMLATILPILLVIFATITKLNSLLKGASGILTAGTIQSQLDHLVTSINHVLVKIPNNTSLLSTDKITSFAQSHVKTVAQDILGILRSSVGSIAGFVTQFILFIFVFLELLVSHKTIVRTIERLNPIGEEVAKLYLSKAAAMTKAMVRGQFVIAFFQGVLGALVLQLCGVHLFAFMALLLTVLSIIPLGGGIIAIPIGIIELLAGNYWQGAVILLAHFLIITNIDNLLRPHLVPKTARLSAALSMLSVFSGIALFGFIGIVIGPVIMILLVTTVQVYLEVNTPK